MAKFCPFCGSEVDQDSIYCLNCGKELPERVSAPPKGAVSWETAPTEPSYEAGYQPPVTYRPIYQPRLYHPSMKAPLSERCLASLENLLCLIPYLDILVIFYVLVKDGIRGGQSLGKGLLGLRVIDYNTGMPATISQSFIRNCLCGLIDVFCCFCLVGLIDGDGRRIGDYVAGTVVIKDL